MFRYSCLLAAALILPGTQAAPAAPGRTATLPLGDAQIEEFLRTARVVKSRASEKGVTGSIRATLTDGSLTHDAHVQVVEQWKREFRGSGGVVEINFRDRWQFNVAAYRIDRLLGLRLVPVSIERVWRRESAAFTWWVDDVMMDEGQRLEKNIEAPDPRCWADQIYLLRVFDQLIDNVDRNLGNALISKGWRLWAIDHTRAFRYSNTPRNPALLMRIDRTVLERLKTLDFATLKRDVGRYLDDRDIRALLSRRDAITAHFTSRGDSVLFDRQNPDEECRTSVQ